MALHAAPSLQLLLENLFQLVQSQAAHCQRPRSVPGRGLLPMRQDRQEQVVPAQALGHGARSTLKTRQKSNIQSRCGKSMV